MTSVYELAEPTCWAEAPASYSFSSLQEIQTCPRKWQLLRSSWGENTRFPERPHPKALEGSIVHEAIELLVRALGKRGLPSIGSARFREAIEAIDFWKYFAVEIAKWNERLAEHPRSGPHFVLRTPPRELANRAIRLFREQYTPLDALPVSVNGAEAASLAEERGTDLMALLRERGALSEVEVAHPDLPFRGIIDLVEWADGGVHLLDFKTGKEKDEHELQLQLYAVLWWRRTGACPAHLAVQYLNHRRAFEVEEGDLVRAEERLVEAIASARSALGERPAEARPGGHCGLCAARARCEEGWTAYQTTLGRPTSGTTDRELTVVAAPSPSGFVAAARGREISVVYDAAVGRHLPELGVEDCLRLIDAVVRDQGKTMEIRPWTEVYRVLGGS